MKEGELLASSREQSIADPTSCDAAQLKGACSRHTAANEEQIEARSSRSTKRSGLSSPMENQRDELMGNLLVSSQDNETHRDDASLLSPHRTGGAATQDPAASFQSGDISSPLRDAQTAGTSVVSTPAGTRMPRRAPLKTKVMPNLTGIFAGDTVRKHLQDMELFLGSQEHRRTLPKIKQRAASIPPKTAAPPKQADAAPFSPRLVGGRRPTNQPISPPSAIRIEGQQAQQTHKTSNRRFRVKLPDASSPVRPTSIDGQQRSATALLDGPVDSSGTVGYPR